MKNWLNFLPLTVFVVIGYAGGAESIQRWQWAWKLASVCALIVLVVKLKELASANRIFVGVNLFLLIGGALAWLDLGQWLAVYGGQLRGASLFAVLSVVGLVSTLGSDRGYINLGDGTPRAVKNTLGCCWQSHFWKALFLGHLDKTNC